MDLVCRHTVVAGLPAVSASGEIDLATVGVLRDALVKLISTHHGARVVLDLDGVTVLDDTGLGIVLGAAGRAREQGGDLVVVAASERLRQRFASTGLDRAVEVLDTPGSPAP